ncbi:MAG: TAXI family TRAP transporter solute-binding subunit [Beijerinckiaceae bacterium]
MWFDRLDLLSRRAKWRVGIFVFLVVAASIVGSAYILKPAPPDRVVLASGQQYGSFHRFAARYKEILARSGVTVEERMTNGSEENLRLLEDPESGVDVAFTQGGLAQSMGAASAGVVMLSSLYYAPMWVFFRKESPFNSLVELRGKKVSVGVDGSGTRALANSIFALNGLNGDNVTMLSMGNDDAIAALKKGDIDATIIVVGADNASVLRALNDPGLRLLSFEQAEAYSRRLPFIARLTVPQGVVDLGRVIPPRDVTLIGTKAMLVARKTVHPAIVTLFLDAAREIHSDQSFFEEASEFPSTAPVDFRVSADADRHRRFGPSFLHHYLPFWLATLIERLIVILVPVLAILVPMFNYLPQMVRWSIRSRVYRWYGELAMLEREIADDHGTSPPIEQWLEHLDRIERAVAKIYTPLEFASEAYTLRQHVDFVRQAIVARNPAQPATKAA